MNSRLPGFLKESLTAAAREWRRIRGTQRILDHDATLWTDSGEARWLGWLDAPSVAGADLGLWSEIASDARAGGFSHALLLGMGGSSLAAEVQRSTLPTGEGHPDLMVLDSVHPDQVAAFEARLDPRRTLVVVSSKSGSTLEPNILMERFHRVVAKAVGDPEGWRRFVAVTDPGSKLERLARDRGFRRLVLGEPTIGGRFSALSPFGLVPAAIQGVQIDGWLANASRMAAACRTPDPRTNPGASLGLLLAASAVAGRDKLTLVVHPAIRMLGAWLEQLIAESTGKRGKGILPFAGESLGPPEVYGDDRLFVAVRLAGELAEGDAERLDVLEGAGHPVVELDVADPLELSAEMYRWEMATAVAGSRLDLDPFDQPDVEAAKVEARRLTEEVERSGALPAEDPFAADEGIALYAPADQVAELIARTGPEPSPTAALRAHLERLCDGDYFALLAFCELSEGNAEAADRIRGAVRDACRVATSVGFGPRYLHSTGQAHKGGPDTGVFLVVTDEAKRDRPIAGPGLTFGQVIAAQARGDAAVLAQRGRRLLRVHLRGPGSDRLPRLADRIERILWGNARGAASEPPPAP